MATQVTIVEVGPRDGLQNEHVTVSTADKIAFIDRLSDANLPVIEVSAFVSPKWVPQMADAAQLFAGITKRPGTRYTALVPNLAGLDRAMTAGVTEIAVFASSTEMFSRKNINQSIEESLAAYKQVCDRALPAGIMVRGYLSTAFGCPFEGDVPPERVADIASRLLDLGVYQVAVSDTIGIAHPGQVPRVLDAVLARMPVDKVALHFHDTRGTALANVLVGLELGITTIDSALGGLGGCPYAPGASGNLATEDLVYMLAGMGVDTGVDLDALVDCTTFVSTLVGHDLPSKFWKAALGERSRRPPKSAAVPAVTRAATK